MTDEPTALAAEAAGASSSGLELLPGGQGIRIGGWTILALKAPIVGEALIEQFTAQLGNVLTLPEMLYGNSGVHLVHDASGATLSFTALDALRAWRQEDLPPLRVNGAHAWQEARKEEISRQDASILEYDWTYTTPYTGTVHPTPPAPVATQLAALPASSRPAPTQHSEASVPRAPEWEDTDEQLDRGLLMARDPILFYAEVPLYESELDDNGVCQLGLRLRVMPRCWFLCLRLWLRVDGCMARLRDTRVMCRFEASSVVLRERLHSEGTAAQLRAAGVPMGGRAYSDADAAAASFSAVAPTCTRLFKLQRLDLGGREAPLLAQRVAEEAAPVGTAALETDVTGQPT